MFDLEPGVRSVVNLLHAKRIAVATVPLFVLDIWCESVCNLQQSNVHKIKTKHDDVDVGVFGV